MTKSDMMELQTSLNEEYGKRLHLGDYNADASCLRLLTLAALSIVRHLIEIDKDIQRSIKRGPTKRKK